MIIHIIPYLARFFKGINDFLTKSFPIRNTGLIVTKFVAIFSFILILGKRFASYFTKCYTDDRNLLIGESL